jgi:hypothetical protein
VAIGTQTTSRSSSTSTAADYGFTHEDPGWTGMQLAISLLIETDEKVETIAKRVGRRSLFTFSNRCRAFTGNSPSDYRKSSSR